MALVKKVGNVAVEATLKAKDLPNWAIEEAKSLGVTLERPAAQALVTSVGERQQRLLRELEKLAIEHGPGATLGVEEVKRRPAAPNARCGGSSTRSWPATAPRPTRPSSSCEPRASRSPRLVPLMARRVRDVLTIATRLEKGETRAQIKESCRRVSSTCRPNKPASRSRRACSWS